MMDTAKQNLVYKKRIILKIYVFWFLKRIVPLIIIQIAFIALAIKIFTQGVFVSEVFKNISIVAAKSYWGILCYLAVAFWNTEFIVELAILAGLGLTSLVIRDIFRSILSYLVIKRKNDSHDERIS